jgi:V/A-type H+/Na+-transporting ATPase subunit E
MAAAAQSLLKEVEEKRKREEARLESDLLSKQMDIRKKTEEEVSRISNTAKAQAAEQSQRERIRIEGAGKLQAKKLLFDATEKMLENNLDSLKQEFADFARSDQYRNLLPQMVQYASKRLGGDIGVICRPEDADLFKNTGSVQILNTNLNSIGGFKAEKKDGTLELDLTFEEILRNHQDEVRAMIQSPEQGP